MSERPTLRVRQGRQGRGWREAQAQVFAEETHCWWCGKYVDQELPKSHPMGRTVDHILELWQGGHPRDRTNLRLAHRRCNSVKSNKARAKPKPIFSTDVTAL